MAAPTSTVINIPSYSNIVTGTNVDAGNNDYVVENTSGIFARGFSVITGTLTAQTVTILAYNDVLANAVDITADLFPGVSALASNKCYAANVPIPVRGIVVRAARSNATNALNMVIFFPRR